MSSGRLTSVARPAQYTDVAVVDPDRAERLGEGDRRADRARRARRRAARRANADREPVDARATGSVAIGVRHCAAAAARDELGRGRAARVRSWSSRYLRIVPSVTSTACSSSCVRPERGERLRPVDRLGDARRLVELELAQRLDRRRDLDAPAASGTSGARTRRIASSRSKSGCAIQW